MTGAQAGVLDRDWRPGGCLYRGERQMCHVDMSSLCQQLHDCHMSCDSCQTTTSAVHQQWPPLHCPALVCVCSPFKTLAGGSFLIAGKAVNCSRLISWKWYLNIAQCRYLPSNHYNIINCVSLWNEIWIIERWQRLTESISLYKALMPVQCC